MNFPKVTTGLQATLKIGDITIYGIASTYWDKVTFRGLHYNSKKKYKDIARVVDNRLHRTKRKEDPQPKFKIKQGKIELGKLISITMSFNSPSGNADPFSLSVQYHIKDLQLK